MSDFDKEAEREKLREKYERDKADREATQRMSDLLLKGATMTNTHCSTCGDPLFRQDGTTFCPSCHGGPEGVEGPDLEAETDETGGTERSEVDASAGGADSSSASPANAPPEEGTNESEEPARANPRRGTARAETPSPEPSNATPDADASRSDSRSLPPEAPARSVPADRAGGDLETAHDSLARALERFAGEAATTDDPRYARECLEAAREAARALSALER